MSPEARARQTIDALLTAAGWHVCDVANTNRPARARPLSFVLASAGAETRFTNGLDPQPRARPVFAFFLPELLPQWLTYLLAKAGSAMGATDVNEAPAFLRRMQKRSPLDIEWGQGGAHFKLRPAQIRAYYPFNPMKTGSMGRRKLTKAALMTASFRVPSLAVQRNVIEEMGRHLSVVRQVQLEVEVSLQRAQALRQPMLAKTFVADQ